MKICLVSASYLPYTSGVAIHVHNLAKNLLEFGHSVEILTTNYPLSVNGHGSRSRFTVKAIGKVIFLPAKGSKFTLPVGINLPCSVRTFLRQTKPDIVHCHGFAPPELAFWAIHYSNSINICTFHTVNIPKSNTLAHIYQNLFKNYNRKIHGKIAVSYTTQQAIKPFIPGPFQIIPNGVDTTKFNPMVKPLSEFNQRANKILYIGRLEKRKGLKVLLQALPLIKQKIPDVLLIVVGTGPEKNYYHQLAQNLRIADSVKFIGFVPQDDLARYYASCDLYCVPTIIPEASSIVILEAMAVGKPVVASDFPGYRELITDNENGLLTRPNDPNDLAEKTIRLLLSNDLKNTFKQNGLKKVAEFDWRNIAKKIEAFYQELLRPPESREGSIRPSTVNLKPLTVNGKRICILYSSRKGGHRFPAEGLLDYLNPPIGGSKQSALFNLLDYTMVGSRLDALARFGDLFLPKVWRQGYKHLESNRLLFTRLARLALGLIFVNPLKKILTTDKFDLVLSFQPEVNAILSFIKNKRMHFATVIVDYSAHSLWVQNCIESYYVGNQFVAEKLKELGVPAAKIKITGIPQKSSFLNVRQIPITEQRKMLNLDPNLPTITVMGGFLGKMVDYPTIIKSIIQSGFSGQMIVVFGKNKKAFLKSQSLIKQAPITIKPCVNLPDVAGVMWAADIIITKPGAVTIAEALTLGKPLILLTPKAGSAQELTFAQNIQKAGAGFHIAKAELVGSVIKQLLSARFGLKAVAQRAEALGALNRTANQLIAESIYELLKNPT
jgi:phosphatidylinositol alpha-mannosyltransferase